MVEEAALLAVNESHTWLVGGSGFLPAGSALVPAWLRGQAGFHGWIAPQPRGRVAVHPSVERTVGCCGLAYRSLAEGNLVCARCGVEVGVGYEDCCGPHWAALFERVAHTAEEADDPWPGELGGRCERLREVLDASRADGLGAPGGEWLRGARSADFCEPESWDHAARVEAPVLSLAGSAGAPELVLGAASFPGGTGLRIGVPFAVLARLVVVGEAVDGPPESPLTWQASDGAEASVAVDAASARVFVGLSGRGVDVQLCLEEGAWTGAWGALRVQLGGGEGGRSGVRRA